MKPIRFTHKRKRPVAIAALLFAVSILAVGCGPPPDITEEDVVGFAISVGGDPTSATDSPSADPTRSLGRLITAYNDAKSKGWEGDTTPPLFATLELADGTKITMWFSSQFPEHCAQVSVLGAGADQSADYRIKSPDLLPAVWELLSEPQRELLRRDENRPWLPE